MADSSRLPDALAGFSIVDAHVHLFPPGVYQAIWRWFDRHAWPIQYRLQARECAAFLLSRGVDRVVALHYSHVPQMARSLNQFVAELAREEPRIVGLATVLPGEPGARAILDEALGPLGLRGVKIHCHVQCVAADDARLDDVYDAAAAHDVPVVIHAGDLPASPHYKCDVRALCTPEAVERALARHPRTTIIVPHLGADHMESIAGLLEHHPRLYLDTTMVLARYFPVDDSLRVTDEAQADHWLARAVAIVRAWPERILYGSDFPGLPYRWDRELLELSRLGLDRPSLAAILGGNATRLFAAASHEGEISR